MESTGPSRQAGFTLIELLIGVVILAILLTIALPSYQGYINKSRARTASADLVALATDLENEFQRQLRYGVRDTTTTQETIDAAIGWRPSDDGHFVFTVESTANSYTLTATGEGSLSGCSLTLDSDNQRTASAPCGLSW